MTLSFGNGSWPSFLRSPKNSFVSTSPPHQLSGTFLVNITRSLVVPPVFVDTVMVTTSSGMVRVSVESTVIVSMSYTAVLLSFMNSSVYPASWTSHPLVYGRSSGRKNVTYSWSMTFSLVNTRFASGGGRRPRSMIFGICMVSPSYLFVGRHDAHRGIPPSNLLPLFFSTPGGHMPHGIMDVL